MNKEVICSAVFKAYDTWAEENAYWDPIVYPSREWSDDTHSSAFKDLLQKITEAVYEQVG